MRLSTESNQSCPIALPNEDLEYARFSNENDRKLDLIKSLQTTPIKIEELFNVSENPPNEVTKGSSS